MEEKNVPDLVYFGVIVHKNNTPKSALECIWNILLLSSS